MLRGYASRCCLASTLAAAWLLSATSEVRAAASPCLQAASAAEQAFALPAGLLTAIGAVETGNQPWSVDVDGNGRRFSSGQQAVDFVQSASRAGGRYIDVGCFQVDLHYHPDAFAALGSAFDPLANAMAAGRFLRALRRDAPSWSSAVARYHSSLESPGQDYAARVFRAFGKPLPDQSESGWPAGMLEFGIHIITPSAAAFGADAGGGREAGLPAVITP